MNNDRGYMAWVGRNPDGFVLNTRKYISTNYLVLHRAACRAISRYAPGVASDAFTGQGYVKICAGSIGALERWIKEKGGDGFTKECKLKSCMRNSSRNVEFEAEVKRALRDDSGSSVAEVGFPRWTEGLR